MTMFGYRERATIGYVVVFCLLLSTLASSLRAEETVRLATGEYPPEHSQYLKHYGVLCHIVEEAFALEDVRVKWGFFPWARAIFYAKSGDWDGVATLGYSDGRAEKMYHSDAIAVTVTRFYHLKSFDFDWEAMSDLRGLSIGGTISYNYGESFNRALEKDLIEVELISTDLLNFKKLLAGRIDIFPMTIGIAEYMLRKHFSPQQAERITYHPKPVREYASYLWMSKEEDKNLELLEKFNNGLEKLRQSGRYREMMEASLRGEYDLP